MTTLDDIKIMIEGMQSDVNKKMDLMLLGMQGIGLELKNIKSDYKKLELENATLRKEINSIRSELYYVANKERSLNIIFHNIEDKKEINEKISEHVTDLLSNSDIVVPEHSMKEFKRIDNQEGNRPLLVTCSSYEFKKLSFDKVKDLSNKGIRIYNDLSAMQREEKKKLIYVHNLLKQYGANSEIKGNGLMLNGKKYMAHEAMSLLKDFVVNNFSGPIEENLAGSMTFIPSSQINSLHRKRPRKPEDSVNKNSKLPKVDGGIIKYFQDLGVEEGMDSPLKNLA